MMDRDTQAPSALDSSRCRRRVNLIVALGDGRTLALERPDRAPSATLRLRGARGAQLLRLAGGAGAASAPR